MKVLTDKNLDDEKLKNIEIVRVSGANELAKFQNDADVFAICGSRAMAISAEKLNFPSFFFAYRLG